jgi:hypothetical protein
VAAPLAAALHVTASFELLQPAAATALSQPSHHSPGSPSLPQSTPPSVQATQTAALVAQLGWTQTKTAAACLARVQIPCLITMCCALAGCSNILDAGSQ